MREVEVTIRLPEALVERAKAAGVRLEEQTEALAAVLEAQIAREEAAQQLREIMDKLNGSMTPEEIEEELARAKAERIAADQVQHQRS
jgi:hypothetical protein